MISTCGNNGWGIFRNYSSIWKAYKTSSTSWQRISKWSGVSVSYSWYSGNSWGWSNDCWGGKSSSSDNWGRSSIDSSFSGQVVGSGGYYRLGVFWYNSSIWEALETSSTGRQRISKRTSVSVGNGGSSNDWSSYWSSDSWGGNSKWGCGNCWKSWGS